MKIGKYVLGETLGKGKFGCVYSAYNEDTLKPAAVKTAEGSGGKAERLLRHEGKMHSALAGVSGVPQLKACGVYPGGYYIALPLLGRSLQSLTESSAAPLSNAQCLAVGERLVGILQEVHRRGVIHRDISPGNVLTGPAGKGIWLCDFGLAAPYKLGGSHAPVTHGNALVGTGAYASRAVRAGVKPSRRDDIEGLGFTLWYALEHGSSPWLGTDLSIESLAEALGENTPEAPLRLIEHARSLSYHQAPDYEYLRSVLRTARLIEP